MVNPVDKNPTNIELSEDIRNACLKNNLGKSECLKSFEKAKQQANAHGRDVNFYGERVSPEQIKKRTRTTNIIPYAIIGLLLLVLIPISVSATTGNEGYIVLPSAYNTLNDFIPTIAFENNGTSADLTYADNKMINMSINGISEIQFGWQTAYVCDNPMDIINATINMTFYSNCSFTMELICHSQNFSSMYPHTSWMNLSVVEGKNTFDNLVLIGANGFVENISSAFDVFPLICTKNNMFIWKMILPANISLDLDQIVCKFYAKSFALHLYNQFFD